MEKNISAAEKTRSAMGLDTENSVFDGCLVKERIAASISGFTARQLEVSRRILNMTITCFLHLNYVTDDTQQPCILTGFSGYLYWEISHETYGAWVCSWSSGCTEYRRTRNPNDIEDVSFRRCCKYEYPCNVWLSRGFLLYLVWESFNVFHWEIYKNFSIT